LLLLLLRQPLAQRDDVLCLFPETRQQGNLLLHQPLYQGHLIPELFL
jgi:hypothetical protein